MYLVHSLSRERERERERERVCVQDTYVYVYVYTYIYNIHDICISMYQSIVYQCIVFPCILFHCILFPFIYFHSTLVGSIVFYIFPCTLFLLDGRCISMVEWQVEYLTSLHSSYFHSTLSEFILFPFLVSILNSSSFFILNSSYFLLFPFSIHLID